MKEHDGRSKGCGIVEFSTNEEAQEAIKTLTDTELKGRMIFVREDRETSSSGGGLGGRGGGGGGGGGCSVYVGNLPYETSWQDLKDVSTSIGAPISFLYRMPFSIAFCIHCGCFLYVCMYEYY